MYWAYVLYSAVYNKVYIGYTSNIDNRLIYHNHSNNKGWTSRYKPWIVTYTEAFHDKRNALKREKELKTAKGREFIWNYIKKNY